MKDTKHLDSLIEDFKDKATANPDNLSDYANFFKQHVVNEFGNDVELLNKAIVEVEAVIKTITNPDLVMAETKAAQEEKVPSKTKKKGQVKADEE